MRSIALLLCLWSSTVTLPAQLDTVLLPMREWTSIDGKTIRAEMLGFEGDGVRLRLDGGQRTLVPVARLSPQDRAELVRVRFRDDYRFEPGEAAKTNYYYSRLTPKDGGHKGVVALISVGPGRFHHRARHPRRGDSGLCRVAGQGACQPGRKCWG